MYQELTKCQAPPLAPVGRTPQEAASSYEGSRPVEHQMAFDINAALADLFRAACVQPGAWLAALSQVAPHRPTQARRAFRDFMSWDDDQRNQAMSALEGAIDWAAEDHGERLQEVICEYQLSPGLAHALYACWPASERDAIIEPYNRWRNAVNKLVTKYQRLAFKLANQQQQRTGGDGEWVSHAFFALIRAAEMYDDPDKAEFISFAYRWIQFDLKKASEREYEHHGLTSYSLDTHSEDRNPLNDIEESFVGLVPGPNRQFVVINRTKEVSAAISVLTERERVVIRRLYGLNEQEEVVTAEDISRDLGVTRARIYQIKALALSKMQLVAV